MAKPANTEPSILHELSAHARPADGSLIGKIREASLEKLSQTPFPTPKDEEWRFLDLRPITRTGFHPAADSGAG